MMERGEHQEGLLFSPSIPYRVKVRPEDFRVEEISTLELVEDGAFQVYRLSKKGWTTRDLLRRIAREQGLGSGAFSYGGLKDRHAETFQTVTVRSERDVSLRTESYSLERIGASRCAMASRFLLGNRFAVVLRRVRSEDLDSLRQGIESALELGIPNYFDDQRFGSYDRRKGFFAEHLLRRSWEEALRSFVAGCHPGTRRPIRERRLFFDGAWGDWQACLGRAVTRSEKKIFGILAARPGDFRRALNALPADEASIRLAAFQSLLWNEIASRFVEAEADGALRAKGKVMPYLFPSRWRQGPPQEVTIPTVSPKASPPEGPLHEIYHEVLGSRELSLQDFALPGFRPAFFSTWDRPLLFIPRDLRVAGEGEDDLYPGFRRVTLCFTLPAGSYGTMLIKRITLKEA